MENVTISIELYEELIRESERLEIVREMARRNKYFDKDAALALGVKAGEYVETEGGE